MFVHVTVAVAAAWLQDQTRTTDDSEASNRGGIHVPLSSLFEIPNSSGSVSTLIPRM